MEEIEEKEQRKGRVPDTCFNLRSDTHAVKPNIRVRSENDRKLGQSQRYPLP